MDPSTELNPTGQKSAQGLMSVRKYTFDAQDAIRSAKNNLRVRIHVAHSDKALKESIKEGGSSHSFGLSVMSKRL